MSNLFLSKIERTFADLSLKPPDKSEVTFMQSSPPTMPCTLVDCSNMSSAAGCRVLLQLGQARGLLVEAIHRHAGELLHGSCLILDLSRETSDHLMVPAKSSSSEATMSTISSNLSMEL